MPDIKLEKMYVFSYVRMIKWSSSVNYNYQQVIILIEKHLTVDLAWDCNKGINRWVFIFALRSTYQHSVEGLAHQCGTVHRAQRSLKPVLDVLNTHTKPSH